MMMNVTLNITDPALVFPGISLLFLAFTNRYLALANIVRQLNKFIDEKADENRAKQIANLETRIKLIKYMQAVGVLAFIFCVLSMTSLFLGNQLTGRIFFGLSLFNLLVSLLISLVEILQSGTTLKIELQRTHQNKK